MNVPGSSDVTKPSEGWKGRMLMIPCGLPILPCVISATIAAKLPLMQDGIPNQWPESRSDRHRGLQNAESSPSPAACSGRMSVARSAVGRF